MLPVKEEVRATGVGILYNPTIDAADKVVAPLEDGSVCMWECSGTSDVEVDGGREHKRGEIVARSSAGLLVDVDGGSGARYTNRPRAGRAAATQTDTSASVSIHSSSAHGFFALQNQVSEVDLQTMQVVSRRPYEANVKALSEASGSLPITVGTDTTLELLDVRDGFGSNYGQRCDVDALGKVDMVYNSAAGGKGSGQRAILPQPYPLSILHLPVSSSLSYGSSSSDYNGEIWVAGRFSSLLRYDRRFFPQLAGHIHSGASLISSMCAVPYPLVGQRKDEAVYSSSNQHNYRSEDPGRPGHTIIAGGDYKLKGSLELYNVHPPRHTRSKGAVPAELRQQNYPSARNRITASSSLLLAVATHGTSIVYSDGSGNVSWVERDAHTPIRKTKLQSKAHAQACRSLSKGKALSPERGAGLNLSYNTSSPLSSSPSLSSSASSSSSSSSLLYSSVPEYPNAETVDQIIVDEGDIVQKILPTHPTCASQLSSSSKHPDFSSSSIARIRKKNLVIWTGEGHLGMLSFGKEAIDARVSDGYLESSSSRRLSGREGMDGREGRVEVQDEEGSTLTVEERARVAEEQARFRGERGYERAMRRALERQADEVSFMRGLGLG